MPAEAKQAVNRRVLSGMRPTGKLHIGHYVGALQNWTRLQNEYDCFFFVADWHALTTDYADTSRVKANILEMAFDWLAAGLDPEKATVFIQSHVPQHAELHLLLSMMTPLGWLERVPTYKEQKENLKEKDLNTYGFLGYPVLMTSDILMYQASYVPVGEDQVAHVEITREIARRFNQFYWLDTEHRFPLDRDDAGRQACVRLPRAAAAAHACPKASRHRWPQDVQELRQLHPAQRARGRGSQEAEDDGDRSGPRPPHRSRQSRHLPGRRSAQNFQQRRDHGQGARRLHHGRHRMHRVQELGRG